MVASLLQIEDGVGRISLGKEGIFGRQLDDSAAQAGVGKEGCEIEFRLFQLNHSGSSFRLRPVRRGHWRGS
jgi:hypothetical protein